MVYDNPMSTSQSTTQTAVVPATVMGRVTLASGETAPAHKRQGLVSHWTLSKAGRARLVRSSSGIAASFVAKTA